jgi:hypothetical protein
MNGLRPTDAQISTALRSHLPERAQAGLRERILEAAETTTQQRSLPSFLGALNEADPVARRRSLLIAAALLLALAFASAVAVGALRLLERDPIQELSLEPPADVPAFVLSSYERLPQLPPVALTWHDSGSTKGRIYVRRSGAVRFDRFVSAEATEPSSYTILSGNRISGMATVGSDKVWVEQDEAIGDDPRVFLRTVLNTDEGPGCEMERDPNEVGNGTAATGWRYVGVEYVAGRPTHHLACVGDIWLDIETRLILRTRAPLADDAGQPIPGQFRTREVTEIVFGEQPAALFGPPAGVARMPIEAYNAYLCTRDLPNEEVVGFGMRDCSTPPAAEAAPLPTSTPMPTVRPSPSECVVPARDPSEPIGPLTWTPASLKEDWPAPVRPESAGGAGVQPMPLTYIDPSGDTGSDVLPCVDIRDVTPVTHRRDGRTYGVGIDLVSNQPPVVDPTELWIAYGVVLDVDRDGVPDWRYGIDNLPVDPTVKEALNGGAPHRAWRTDLHTDRTERLFGQGYEDDLDPFFIGHYPDGKPGTDARLHFGGRPEAPPSPGAKVGIELDMPLYAWASVIQDGRVVATDYAPDVGWLLPLPDAKPGGTFVLDEPFPVRLSMRVADGWTLNRGEHYKIPDGYGGVALDRDSGNTGLAMLIVDQPAKDACDPSAGTIDLGPSVADLATFLAGLPLVDMSVNTDVTIDGYRGKYLEYRRTGRQEECGWGDLGNWPAISQGDIDESHQVWILDVDGVRLVIAAFSRDSTSSETVKAEFRRIVESIQIEP